MDNTTLLSFRDNYAQTIKMEHAITARVLAALPDTKHDYRPDPKAKSGPELAWHVAASEIWFLESIVRGEFSGQEIPMPKSSMTGKEIASWYEEHFNKVFPRIQNMSADDCARETSFFGIATMPAVMFLGWSIAHAIHHRGQLSTYLRPMGGKVPQIYGGSADEPMKM